MSPRLPAPKRDDTEARLEAKIDSLAERVSELRELVAGKIAEMAAGVHAARNAAQVAATKVDMLDQRVGALEASKHKAEGAATLAKALWVAVAALAGTVGHWLSGR